ncbi:hypothetical protein [Lutibacter sp.]
MRLTLNKDDAISLMIALQNNDLKNILSNKIIEILNNIKNQIEKDLNTPVSYTKTKAAEQATKIRQQRAKEKICDAVNSLHSKNAKVNVNSVSKKSEVAYNTVKKYSYLLYQID